MNKFLKSKFGTGVLTLGLIAVLFVTGRLLAQKYQTDKQIKQLQARADKIKGENQQLADLVNYLNSDQYQEKAAREQLNLKKEGEVVVALPQDREEQVSSAQVTVQTSNPKKWYEYFFRNE